MTDRTNRTERGDWGELASHWKEPENRTDALRERHRELSTRVRRRAARDRWIAVAEVLVGVCMVLLAAIYALGRPDPLGWSVLLYTVLAVAAALAFSRWNRRDTAHRDLASPADAIAAARKEFAVRGRAVRFGWILLFAHAMFFVLWLPLSAGGGSLGSFLFLLAWLAAFAAILVLIARRVRREARELARLADDMDDEGGGRF